jgi:glycosyltransferase involved in cell wall biosynthesis
MPAAQPPVTWLMPVKNGMPYLPATLASIADQNYHNHKILTRDDGSNDSTLDELRRWIPGRIPGRIFSGPSWGVGRSLAFLVQQADTEFCARIDADDVNLPERLERQVEFLLAHPKVGVLGSRVRVIDSSGAEGELWAYETSDAEIRWLTRYASRLCHPAVMFRRSLVLAAGNYRDVPYEDGDLWLRMTTRTEMNNLPDALLYYRRSNTSVTGDVEDWFSVLRSVAAGHAASLFPGVWDPAAALELWESTLPQYFQGNRPYPQAKLWHLRQIRRSAMRLAEVCGKPRNYFSSTQSFVAGKYSLKRRFLRRFGLGPLLNLRDSLVFKQS